MKCVILSAGEISDYAALSKYIDEGDYVIAADGGYRHLEPLGIGCNYCLGDFDSMDYVPNEADEKYPSQKDDTDTMLAVKHGLRKGFDDFVILGGLGGRLDHTLANISTLEYLKSNGAGGMLIDETTAVRLAYAGDKVTPLMLGQYFSIFPYGCASAVVSMGGVEYPTDRLTFYSSFPLGVSNSVINPDEFNMTIHEGKILIIECLK